MFDKLMNRFDDFDMDKVMEVVNLVWNNREKIMDLIENLPEMLRDTGDNIESAGESAIKASVFLTGDNKGGTSAGKMSELAAGALDRCFEEIQGASKVMAALGKELDDIKIPNVKPKYIEVLGNKVIGGIDFDEDGLFDNPAKRLQDGAGRLNVIGEDLGEVAKSLRELGGMLTDTGKDLNNVGEKLKSSGTTLRSFSELRK
ncbi:MAG: hypothetical protein AAF490_12130 [Chloroflexota bacterium]